METRDRIFKSSGSLFGAIKPNEGFDEEISRAAKGVGLQTDFNSAEFARRSHPFIYSSTMNNSKVNLTVGRTSFKGGGGGSREPPQFLRPRV